MEFNLLESSTFTTTVKCQLPGDGVDVRRDFAFKATFKAMPQDEWEDLIADATRSEALGAVLVDVEGVPGGTTQDGTQLTPVEVTIKNPFTCDAAFTAYVLYTTDNGRTASQAATERKNSKRSRKR